ncbi:MAG: hypothetical protein LBF18_23915 [Pantoea sp.]|uniref:hypothetical protein n=1 Tax=Pantoea brenneri TaxID=472694 RepID=UPI0019818993|nr:hypothetical protein [Pantoea brenneri]MBZ6398058.1 hypothetical protein [Pantoea sp.]MDU7867710.1 hypothetical protein [Pantoea sp.]
MAVQFVQPYIPLNAGSHTIFRRCGVAVFFLAAWIRAADRDKMPKKNVTDHRTGARMNRSDRGKKVSMKGESYAVNKKTVLALIGVYLLPILGALTFVNGVSRLLVTVWMYVTDAYDLVHGARELCLALAWITLPFICYGYLLECQKMLKRYRLPD